MAYTDLKWDGKQNMGGLLMRAYWMPVADLGVLPALSAIGKLNVIANIIALEGKGFIEIYSTPNKNKIDDNTIGETDGKSKENVYECFYPGDEEAVAEFEAQAMNTPCVLLIPDTRGRMRVIGLCRLNPATTVLSAELPAYMTGSNGTSGAAKADLKGKTFQFTANAPHAPLFYTGSVPLLTD
jgi:hypothetical protein